MESVQAWAGHLNGLSTAPSAKWSYWVHQTTQGSQKNISVGKMFGAELLGFMQAEFSFVLSLMESISAKTSEAIIFLNENSSVL